MFPELLEDVASDRLTSFRSVRFIRRKVVSGQAIALCNLINSESDRLLIFIHAITV